MTFRFPSITLAQVLAALTWVVGQAVAWGWVDNDTGQWVLSLVTSVISLGWQLADAYLRGKRAHALALAYTASPGTSGVTVERKLIS